MRAAPDLAELELYLMVHPHRTISPQETYALVLTFLPNELESKTNLNIPDTLDNGAS